MCNFFLFSCKYTQKKRDITHNTQKKDYLKSMAQNNLPSHICKIHLT